MKFPKSFQLGEFIKNVNKGRDKKIKLVKLGKLKLSGSHIGVGEIIYDKMKAIKKGIYNIYEFNGSLAAIPNDIKPKDEVFKLTDRYCLCDIGMFSFNDCDNPLINSDIDIENKNKKRVKKSVNYYTFPDCDMGITKVVTDSNRRIRDNDAYLIKKGDLETCDIEIFKKEKGDVIAIFAGNKIGDGSFPIYRSKNLSYFIMADSFDD